MVGRVEAQNDLRREAIKRGEDPRVVDEYIRESNQAMASISNAVVTLVFGMFAWGLMVVVILTAYQTLPILINGLKVWLSNPFYRVIAVLVAMAIAWLLLMIKARWLIAYGLMETAFGVATLYDNATDFSQDKVSFLVMFAAMYILVRGFDNLRTGYQDKYANPLSQQENKS